MFALQRVFALLAIVSLAAAHTVITLPGWRGDNLHSNGTVNENDYETGYYPYGMQWMYPCGGMKVTTNRTYWPITGGAVAVQPGWFQGHSTAFFYVNLGLGTIPPNYSHPVVPVFQVVGPTNNAYPGLGFCLPQVPMPANITAFEGMNVTIQVVEAAKHGAALYSCVDVTLTSNMSKVTEITNENCYNSTELGFNLVYSTIPLTSGGNLLGSFTNSRTTLWSTVTLVTALLAGSWLL